VRAGDRYAFIWKDILRQLDGERLRQRFNRDFEVVKAGWQKPPQGIGPPPRRPSRSEDPTMEAIARIVDLRVDIDW
jgi:hypothetical protein